MNHAYRGAPSVAAGLLCAAMLAAGCAGIPYAQRPPADSASQVGVSGGTAIAIVGRSRPLPQVQAENGAREALNNGWELFKFWVEARQTSAQLRAGDEPADRTAADRWRRVTAEMLDAQRTTISTADKPVWEDSGNELVTMYCRQSVRRAAVDKILDAALARTETQLDGAVSAPAERAVIVAWVRRIRAAVEW